MAFSFHVAICFYCSHIMLKILLSFLELEYRRLAKKLKCHRIAKEEFRLLDQRLLAL